MKAVRIMGGLGNQLFQYALYKELELKGYDVTADLSWFDNPNRKYYFPNQLKELGLEVSDIRQNKNWKHSVFELFLLRMTNEKRLKVGKSFFRCAYSLKRFNRNKFIEVYPVQRNIFEPMVYSNKDVYCFGYWQNIKYFNEALDLIKNEIAFPELSDDGKKIEKQIISSNSVSVHIRINDYKNENFEETIGNKYYQSAIDYINRTIENPHYFIFSNNINKARNLLGNKEVYTYVNINDRHNGLGDMHLISLCKHNIVAYSTFSWWASILNKNENCIRVFSKGWSKENTSDFNMYPSDSVVL